MFRMRALLIFSTWLAAAPAFAGSVSPEAASFLKKLREKVAGIQTLSWEVRPHEGTTAKGYYRKGGYLKISHGLETTHFSLEELITPEGLSQFRPSEGVISVGGGVPLERFVGRLWFYLPFLSEGLLSGLGDVSLAPSGQGRVILTVSVKAGPGREAQTLCFTLRTTDLALERFCHTQPREGGHQDLKVASYETTAGYELPVATVAAPIPDHRMEIVSIRLDQPLLEGLFGFQDEHALTHFTDLSFENLTERQSKGPAPREAASLLYSLGRLLEAKDDWKSALEGFRKAAEAYPSARAAHLKVGDALAHLKERDEAVKVLEKMQASFPDHQDVVCARLVDLFDEGQAGPRDREAAVKWCQVWTESRPQSFNAWVRLGELLNEQNALSGSIRAYGAALKLPGVSPSQAAKGKLVLGRTYLKAGNRARAEELFSEVEADKELAMSRLRRQAQMELLKSYRDSGRLDALLVETQRAYEASPEDAFILRKLATIWNAKGDRNRAAEPIGKLIDTSPEEFLIYQHELFGYPPDAQQKLRIHEKLFQKLPGSRGHYARKLIELYRQVGQPQKAERLAAELVKDGTDDPGALAAVVRHYLQVGQADTAVTFYESAVQAGAKITFTSDDHAYSLAQALQRAGKTQLAMELAEKLSESAKQSHTRDNAFQILVSLLRAAGRDHELATELEKKAKAAPDDQECLKRLATVHSYQGQHSKAADTYGALVRLDPNDGNYSLWANALYSAQRYDDAIAAYREFFEKHPRYRPSYYSNLLHAYERTGRLDEAVKEFNALSDDKYTNASMLSRLAQSLSQAKRYEEAIAMYRKAVGMEKHPSNQWSYREAIARVLIEQRKYEEAETFVNKLSEDATQSHQKQNALQMVVTIRRERGRLDSWVKAVEQEANSKPKDAECLRRLAMLYYSSQDYGKSADTYRKLIELEPKVENYTQWINALSSSQRHADQIAAYEELFKKFPDRKASYIQSLINVCQNAGQGDKAIQLAREYAKSRPQGGSAASQLGQLLRQNRKHDEALAAYREAIKLSDSTSSRFYWHRSIVEIYQEAGKLKEAETEARELIKAASSDSYQQQARSMLVSVLQKSGGLGAFIKELESQAASSPKDEETLGQLIDAYRRKPDYPKAAETCVKLIAVSPTNSNYSRWIECLGNANDQNGLIEAYGKYFAAFPNEKRNRLLSLAHVCRSAGKQEAALEVAREYAKLNASNASAQSQCADLLRSLKEYEAAIEVYEKAMKLDTGSSKWQWKLNIAQIYQSQGKLKEAEASARDIIATATSDGYRQNAARLLISILRSSGRDADYIRELNERVTKNPTDKEALKQLLAVYQSQGKHAEAAEIYKKLIQAEPTTSHYTNWINSLSNAGKYADQIAAYQEFFAKFPEQKRNHGYGLMCAYRNAGKTDEAIKAGQEYIAASTQKDQAAGQVAQLLGQMNRFDDAVKAYELAIKSARSQQNRWNWRYQLAQFYKQQGKWEEAETLTRELAKVATQEHQKNQASTLLVEILQNTGGLEEWLKGQEKLVAADPRNEKLLSHLASIYIRAGMHDDASNIYRKLVELNASVQHYQEWLNCLQNAGQHEERIAVYEKFFKKFPDQRRNHLSNLISAYRSANRMDDAIRAAREYAEVDKQNSYPMRQVGDLLKQAGKPDEAAEAYRKALARESQPNNKWQLLMTIAQTYKNAGHNDKALAVARELIATAPQKSQRQQAEKFWSQLLRETGGERTMAEELEKRLEVDPKDQATIWQLISIYRARNAYDKVAPLARRLLSLDASKDHYLEWIDALGLSRNYEGQVAALGEFFKEFPGERPNHILRLMWANQKAGKIDEAIAVGREYEKLKPQGGLASAQLADILRGQKLYDEAAEGYKRAVKLALNPYNKWDWEYRIAEIHGLKGRTGNATTILRELVRTAPRESYKLRAARLLDRLSRPTPKMD